MSPYKKICCGVCLVLLAACSAQVVRRDPPAVAADADLIVRFNAQRAAISAWTLSGRTAISNGQRGGSGRIDWNYTDRIYTVALSAPITKQSWKLTVGANAARLEGIAGGPQQGTDPDALLRAATGWEIPVRALSNWVLGLAAEADEYGSAEIEYDASGLPKQLSQSGWQIQFQQWKAIGASPGVQLPIKLQATRGEARVRLIVDDWQLEQ